jgi:hypothetical protein
LFGVKACRRRASSALGLAVCAHAAASLLVWMAFGAVALVPAMETLSWLLVARCAKLLARGAAGRATVSMPDMPDRRLIRRSHVPAIRNHPKRGDDG